MNLITSIVTSEWFLIVAFVWCLIAIASRKERDRLMGVIQRLTTKPTIFQEDPEPTSVNYYARGPLETVARTLTKGATDLAKRLIGTQQALFSNDQTSSRKMMGSVFLFVVMLFFFYADLIAIFNTLEVYGIMQNVPVIFRRYEYAVTFGSFFTIVVAGLMLFEIFGKGEFTSISEQKRVAKTIATWLSVLLVISGLAVVISLGLIRYRPISQLSLAVDQDISSFNDLVMTILVPANSILSTALIASEGFKGLVPFFTLFAVAGLYVFAGLGYAGWFLVDIVYRIVLIALYVLFYFLLTPLDRILAWRPFGSDESEESKPKGDVSPKKKE